MGRLTVEEFEKKLAAVPEVEPDEIDLQMLAEIDAETDHGAASLEDAVDWEQYKAERDFKGKILVRVPKTLHRELAQSAKDEGISLNQFILYKLAKN